MDIFSYDHEELARRVQTGLDRMTVNYLRGHHARVRRDDLDFHGIEHVDLEVESDGHRLVVRQSGLGPDEASKKPPPAELSEQHFESTFDGQPASAVSIAMLAQWLAMLPEGEHRDHQPKREVDPTNPFLAEAKSREEQQAANPFLAERPKPRAAENPFAPDDTDKKRRAAFDWLAGDD